MREAEEEPSVARTHQYCRAEAAAEVFRESVRWDPAGSHVKYMYLGQVA
jgi:hypothetical protein